MNNKKIEVLRDRRASLVRKRKSCGSQKEIKELDKIIKDIDDLIKYWSK